MKKVLLLAMLSVLVFACKESVVGPDSETTLTLSAETLTLNVDATATLTVVGPEYWAGSAIKWESTNPKVASVDAKTGVVTGVSNGTTSVYGFAVNGNAVRGQCAVTVGNEPVTSIKAYLTKAGGDYTKAADLRADLYTGFDTLDLVYVITPANATVQTVSYTRSDTLGNKIVTIAKAVTDEKTPGIWRAKVTANVADAAVKVTVVSGTGATAVKSNVSTVTVLENPAYTATKGYTEYQTAPITNVYMGTVDTLVIKGLPNNGAFAPFDWRLDDPISFELTPFSYKVAKADATDPKKKDSTVWGALIVALDESEETTGATVTAMNADGADLSWTLAAKFDTTESKDVSVSFGSDSLSMPVGGDVSFSDLGVTYKKLTSEDGATLTLSIITRPAAGTVGVNKKWYLTEDRTAMTHFPEYDGNAMALASFSEGEISAELGTSGQGDALAIVELTNSDGKKVYDTMKLTVVDYVTTGYDLKLAATYKTTDFGAKIQPIAKLYNFAATSSVTLDEATLYLKKGTVVDGEELEEDKLLETVTSGATAATGAGVEASFTKIEGATPAEIEGAVLEFAFTANGIEYTAERSLAPDNGLPYAAPRR